MKADWEHLLNNCRKVVCVIGAFFAVLAAVGFIPVTIENVTQAAYFNWAVICMMQLMHLDKVV